MLEAAQTTDSIPVVASGVRILLVDDDPRVRRVLASGLTRAGFHVFTADDAGPAIELADQMMPDLVIVDFNMPTCGVEVVKTLKGRHGPAIWIAVLSGGDDKETRAICFDAGADDVIHKPVQLPDLRRRMAAAARSQQAQDIARFEDAAVRLATTACKVGDLLRSVVEVHAASERPVRFEVDCEESLVGSFDLALVERVLHNLVGSAVRYCAKDGAIRIRAERIDHQIELRVSNDGPPVSEDGSGLYFCRLVAEAHGGTIAHVPTPDGTTFCVRLPV